MDYYDAICILIIILNVVLDKSNKYIDSVLNNYLFKFIILIIIFLIYDKSPKVALFMIFFYINIIFMNYKYIIKEGFIDGIKDTFVDFDIDSEIASLDDNKQVIMAVDKDD
jgi:hypothetical protein